MQSEYDSTEWKLNSWKGKKISQQPIYQNEQLLNEQLNIIESYTDGISTYSQINDLKKSLEEVHNNKALVLISGDCCEPFSESDDYSVKMKCAFINCLAHLMNNKYGKQVISIGRIAGQYSKPRSNNSEIIDQKEYYVYKGENINSIDINNRSPDPFKLVEGYNKAKEVKLTINKWNNNKSCFKTFLYESNKVFNRDIDDIINKKVSETNSCIYSCHEGLLINYESALTRKENDKYYDLSAEMLWIGERTNKIDEAHIEFFRGISNPIGIKVSVNTDLPNLLKTINLLNPNAENGKILLITRLGAKNTKAKEYITNLSKMIIESKLNVILICDAMHGNTQSRKFKVRELDDLIEEINFTAEIYKQHNLSLHGIHLESTPFDVTECIDSQFVKEIDPKLYTTLCDPRINFNQSIELVLKTNI